MKESLKQKYHVSLSKKQIYDLSELNSFCSEECLISSNLFHSQLDETPVYLRTENKKITLPRNVVKPKQLFIVEHIDTNVQTITKTTEKPNSQENEYVKKNISEEQREDDFPSEEDSSDESLDPEDENDDNFLLSQTDSTYMPTLSSFGVIFCALENWCNQYTLDFLYGKSNEDTNNLPITVQNSPVLFSPSPKLMRKQLMKSMISTQ